LTVEVYDFVGPDPAHQPISPIGPCAFFYPFFFFLQLDPNRDVTKSLDLLGYRRLVIALQQTCYGFAL
jgi:hypothetical protein